MEAIAKEHQDVSNFNKLELVVNESSTARQYRGVKGWLVVFCLGLFILPPILTPQKVVAGLKVMNIVYMETRGIIIQWIVLLIISGFYSVFAGIRLWKVKSKAVETAERFLLFSLGLSVLAIIQVIIIDLPFSIGHHAVGKVLQEALLYMFILTVGLCYLRFSKRVVATYLDQYEEGLHLSP